MEKKFNASKNLDFKERKILTVQKLNEWRKIQKKI